MVRSYWKGTLIVALAWPGLLWGQTLPGTLPAPAAPLPVGAPQSPGMLPIAAAPMPAGEPPPAAAPAAPAAPGAPAAPQQTPPEYTITVAEPGKPPQKCRLLRYWKMPDGTRVKDVQDIATGETMTILDTMPKHMMATSVPASGTPTATESRVFHWGGNEMRPSGVPMPPGGAAPMVVNPGMPESSAPMVVSPGVPESSTPVVVQPAKKSGGLFSRWFGDKSVQSAPVMQDGTVMGSQVPAHVQQAPVHMGPGDHGPALGTQAPDKMAHTGPRHPEADAGLVKGGPPTSDGVAAKPAPPSTESCCCIKPSNPGGLVSASTPKPFSGAMAKHQPYYTPGDKAASSAVVKSVDTPQPSDWRRSWGKPDNWESQTVKSNTKPTDKVQAPTTETVQSPTRPADAWKSPLTKTSDAWKPPTVKPSDTVVKLPATTTDAVKTPAKPAEAVQAPRKPADLGSLPPAKPTQTVQNTPPPPPPVWPEPTPVKPVAPPVAVAPPPPPKPVPPAPPPPAQTVQVDLPRANTKQADPLMKPEDVAAQRTAKTAEPKKVAEPAPVVVKTEPKPVPAAAPANPNAPGIASTQRVPLGSGSVAAAYGQNPPAYLPVPVVTLPGPTAPRQMVPQQPAPPPPQPARDEWANAFTPSTRGNVSEAVASNAFSSGLTPPHTAYGQPAMMYPGMNAMAMNSSPPQLYAGPMPPSPVMPAGGMMNPYAMAYARPMMPAYPNMVMPVNYPVPMPAAYPAQAAVAQQNPQQLMLTLKDALYPSHREWAADALAGVDWRTNPQVVEALLLAAREDPAATVRAGCVRALGKMNVNTTTVVATLQGLKSDPDPRVRQDVEHTLTNLGGTAQPVPAVQPAGGLMPPGTK